MDTVQSCDRILMSFPFQGLVCEHGTRQLWARLADSSKDLPKQHRVELRKNVLPIKAHIIGRLELGEPSQKAHSKAPDFRHRPDERYLPLAVPSHDEQGLFIKLGRGGMAPGGDPAVRLIQSTDGALLERQPLVLDLGRRRIKAECQATIPSP